MLILDAMKGFNTGMFKKKKTTKTIAALKKITNLPYKNQIIKEKQNRKNNPNIPDNPG